MYELGGNTFTYLFISLADNVIQSNIKWKKVNTLF